MTGYRLPRSLDPLTDESISGYLLRLAHRLDMAPSRLVVAAGLLARPTATATLRRPGSGSSSARPRPRCGGSPTLPASPTARRPRCSSAGTPNATHPRGPDQSRRGAAAAAAGFTSASGCSSGPPAIARTAWPVTAAISSAATAEAGAAPGGCRSCSPAPLIAAICSTAVPLAGISSTTVSTASCPVGGPIPCIPPSAGPRLARRPMIRAPPTPLAAPGCPKPRQRPRRALRCCVCSGACWTRSTPLAPTPLRSSGSTPAPPSTSSTWCS